MPTSQADTAAVLRDERAGRWAPWWVLAYVALWPLPGIAETVLGLGAIYAAVRMVIRRLQRRPHLLSPAAWALTSILFLGAYDPLRSTIAWWANRVFDRRSHQLRAHLAAIGHPILGDPLYGAQARQERAQAHLNPEAPAVRPGVADTREASRGPQATRLRLHATALAFRHPLSGDALQFDSACPF
jgi:hypothetical protein